MFEQAGAAVAKGKGGDRHKPAMVVRLPEAYREPLRACKKAEQRSITTVVQRALNDYFKRHKVAFEPPAEEDED